MVRYYCKKKKQLISAPPPVFAVIPSETGNYEIRILGGTLECSWELFLPNNNSNESLLEGGVGEGGCKKKNKIYKRKVKKTNSIVTKGSLSDDDDEDDEVQNDDVDETEKAMRNRVTALVEEANSNGMSTHSYTKILKGGRGGKLVGSYKFIPDATPPEPNHNNKEKEKETNHQKRPNKKASPPTWMSSNTQLTREKDWHKLMRPVLGGGGGAGGGRKNKAKVAAAAAMDDDSAATPPSSNRTATTTCSSSSSSSSGSMIGHHHRHHYRLDHNDHPNNWQQSKASSLDPTIQHIRLPWPGLERIENI